MTPWCDQWYSSMDTIVPAMSALLILGSTSRSLYLSSNLFCPASRCTVSSHTPVTPQSKVHLHQQWNRKMASFRFSWATVETCCLLSGIPSAFLLPCFITMLQMSSTFLLVSTLILSGLSSPYSLMSNLVASGWNLSCMYISWSHMAKISGPHAWCTHSILSATLQYIVLWHNVPSQGNSIFAYLSSSLLHQLLWFQGLIPLVCSLCPDCSLL